MPLIQKQNKTALTLILSLPQNKLSRAHNYIKCIRINYLD